MQEIGMQTNARLLIVKGGTTETLPEEPVSHEEKLESFICDHPDALGQISILERQTGTRADRPDIIAADVNGNILVIEVKDEPATYDVVSQVLRYALWAQNNPDSVRLLWSRLSPRPEGKEPDWSNLTVGIVVVAPDFENSVLRATSAVRYPTSLVQFNRFSSGGSEFVVVRDVSIGSEEGSLPVRTSGDYTSPKWHREEMGRNAKSIQIFFALAREIERLTSRHRWALDAKYNQSDMNMKLGAHVAFGIAWDTTKSLYLYFHHVQPAVRRRFEKLGVKRGDSPNYCYVPIEDKGIDVRKLDALFKSAYEGTMEKYGS